MESNIYILGVIGEDEQERAKGNPVYTYNDALADYQRAKDSQVINLWISSPGGDLYEGKDIAKLFKSSGKIIRTHNIGDVASIAFNIYLAASKENRFYYPDKGRLLIHYPWGEAVGNADELQEYSDQLRDEEKILVKELTQELGVDEEVLRGYMKQERFLNEDEVELLQIATIVKNEFKAVAKLKNVKMNEKEVKEELGTIKKMLDGIKAMFKPKALLIQDVNGVQIDLPEIETIDQLQTGISATVEGSPAEGEYTLDDGSVLKFEAGVLSEIMPPADDMEALKSENESLKKQLEDLQNSLNAKEKEKEDLAKESETKLKEVETTFEAFKAKFSKEFIPGEELGGEERETTVRKPFKNKQ